MTVAATITPDTVSMAARTRYVHSRDPFGAPPPLVTHAPMAQRRLALYEPLGMLIMSQCHEVLWPDGSRAALHPVMAQQETPNTPAHLHTTRAYHHEGAWVLFDLLAVAPHVARQLLAAQVRAHPGLLMYGLPAVFGNARHFLLAARERSLAIWVAPSRASILNHGRTPA